MERCPVPKILRLSPHMYLFSSLSLFPSFFVFIRLLACDRINRTLEVFKDIKIKNKKERGYNIKGAEVRRQPQSPALRRRIFGVWPHSMGSALGGCLMHHAVGTLLW